MTDSDKFADRLRTILDDAQMSAPSDGWDRINRRISRQRLLKTVRIISYAAACIAVAAVFAYNMSGDDMENLYSRESLAGAYEGILAYSEPEPSFSGDISAGRQRREPENICEHHASETITDTDDTEAAETVEVKAHEKYVPMPDHSEDRLTNELDAYEGPDDTEAARPRRFNIAAAISPSTVSGSSDKGVFPNKLFSSTYLKNEFEMTHSLPVSYGISFSYDINRYLSIGTGLNYTYYRSRYSAGSEYIRQTLHYLSVPVSIYFNMLDSRWLRLYAVGGASIDKCISGDIVYNMRKEGGSNPFNKEIMEDRFQFSANIGAGIMVKATEYMAIFAEPQYVHYFNMGSTIQSYRTKYTDGFTVSVGLRFSF